MTKPPQDRQVSLSILPGSYNVLREPLRPVACWSLGESVFSFGQTFAGRGTKKDFARFRELRAKHPDAVIALFGHADTEGNEDYNHDLGALRARAVYGVLVRDPEIWCEMYQANPDALVHVKQRLRSKYTIPKNEVGVGAATRDAIAQHIAELAGPLQMAPEEFLGEHGQYSMQSCSAFNPLRRNSDELYAQLDVPQRIAFERPNRRVIAFFFPPQTHVDGWWPCPRPGEGVAGCKPRFWSDAKARRSTTRPPRQFVPAGLLGGGPVPPVLAAEDTFACRFYDRIAHRSACERTSPWIPPEPDDVVIIDDPVPEVDPTDTPDDPPPKTDPVPQLVLMCAHPSHYNSGYLGKSVVPDRIEIVPEDEEIVIASIVPGDVAKWKIVTMESAEEELPVDAPSTMIQIGHVLTDEDLGFFGLMNIDPEVRTVSAECKGKELVAEIHAYPFDPYERNFESLIERLHALFRPAIVGWAVIGELLADGINFDLFDPEKCELTAWGQWQESPVAGTFAPDHRAFFAYDVRLTGEPIVEVDVNVGLSFDKIMEKAKKVPGMDKVLDKVPDNVRHLLRFASFIGGIAGAVNGPLSVSRHRPDEVVRTGKATGVIDYSGQADVSAFDHIAANVELKFSVEIGVSLRLDLENRKIVVALDGKFISSKLTIVLLDKEAYNEPVFEGLVLDPLEFELPLPGKGG